MRTQQPREIRWGIIGPGKIAHKFTQDLLQVANCKLIAVASRSQEKADDFAQEYQVKHAFNSYEQLVQCDEVDVIYIATPHSFHKEHSILCLQHRKAVLCEKPFAMNLDEVEEMIATAQRHDVLLMEALWTYFLPHYNYVLDLIEKETYGKVLSLRADFGFFTPFDESSRVFDKKTGGGSLLDIGIYPIFAALSSLGIPNDIQAKATFFENGTDANCSIIFHYENSNATLFSTLLAQTPTEAIFTCEKAKIIINSRFHEPSTVTIKEIGYKETLDFNYNTIGYSYEIEHFNQLLRDGKKESDVMTFEMSRNLIKTIDAVRNLIDLKY